MSDVDIISIRDNSIEADTVEDYIRQAIYTAYELSHLCRDGFLDSLVFDVLTSDPPHANSAHYYKVAMALADHFPEEFGGMIDLHDDSTITLQLPLAEAVAMYSLTGLRCGQMVDVALTYLSEKHPNRFNLHRLKLNSGAMHFHGNDHVLALVEDVETGTWYAFSPANAFNSLSNGGFGITELERLLHRGIGDIHPILPVLNGQQIQRPIHLLTCTSQMELIFQVHQMEGYPDISLARWNVSPFIPDPELSVRTKNPEWATFTERSFSGDHPIFDAEQEINVREYISAES